MNKELEKQIIKTCDVVRDFPKKGVNFINISPLFENVALYNNVIDEFTKKLGQTDKILGIESRGFLLAAPLAVNAKLPLILVRKSGKVPFKPVKQEYNLEYGQDTLEISEVQIAKGDKIAIVDDILATGGTAEATIKLVRKLGGEVSCLYVLGSLSSVDYHKILDQYNVPVVSLATFI